MDTLKRLSGPTALTTSTATQYTVPAATTTTVRSIHVANESGSAAALTISIGADGAGKRFYRSLSIAGNGALDWSGVLVLGPGERIEAYSDVGSALTMTMSGVESA